MKSKEKEQIMKEYGWSENIKINSFTFANKSLVISSKVDLQLKGTTKQTLGFGIINFSSTKIKPRTKYLCSCDEIPHQTTIFI
jgi:hypothetical protein